MKKLIFLIAFFLTVSLPAQELHNESIFSKVYFSVLGGTNFNTLPTAGTALNFEVESNLTSNLYGKISIGYSTLYDNNSYDVKSYGYVHFNNYSKYETRLLVVDRVRYTIIPITIGAEYSILKNNISPVAFFELGYNYSNSLAEGKTYDGIGGTYDTVNEIPTEYRKTATEINGGSSFTMGIGLGLKYKLTDRMDLNLRYMYHYNELIINNNQVLIGLTF